MEAEHGREPAGPDAAPAQPFPRVPAAAWSWLQRSRPVLAEVARRLTGQAPDAAFLEALRARFAEDPFTRAIVCDVIADVAFSGRVPPQRPPGVSWDRGLVWWAATLAGTTPAAYDRRVPAGAQARLFGPVDQEPSPRSVSSGSVSPGPVSPGPVSPGPVSSGRWAATAGATSQAGPPRGERAALAAALRALLAASEGESVPAESVRRLLMDLEGEAG